MNHPIIIFVIISFLFLNILMFGCPIEKGEGCLNSVPQFSSKIRVDGILDEKEWEQALLLELNYEVEPGENIPPLVKTEILIASSKNELYVAFQAYDPMPEKIRARLSDRDQIWSDDYVGIILDTFNDSRRTYNFYCNPYGIQAEKTMSANGISNPWDSIWYSAGKITKNGFTIEMSIPFRSLRFQNKEGSQIWGIDAIRYYPRNIEHLIGLFPRDRNNNCYMCQSVKLIGFNKVRSGKKFELDPTFSTVFTQERQQFPYGKYISKSKQLNPGITAQWNFTPNLSLNAAINPDFSNVEADAAQLDVNTQFSLYYPEKRPFFLEGASIFFNRNFLIYTRAIADPDWGIKLTGKEGKHAIGFYSVQDGITNIIIPGNQISQFTSLDLINQSTVARYRWDMGNFSNLGVILTDREGENYYNRLASIDGDIRITKKDQIRFQLSKTQTRYPEETANQYNQPTGILKGTGFSLLYSHDTKNFDWFVDFQSTTPHFRADLGFVPQVNFKFFHFGGGYTWRKSPGFWFTKISLNSSVQSEKDNNNHLIQENINFQLNYDGPLQSFLHLDLHLGKRKFMGLYFDEKFIAFKAGFRPSSTFSLTLEGVWGDQIDIVNIKEGKRFQLNPSLQYKFGRSLCLNIDHLFEKFNVDGGRLYSANISNFHMVYQFNKRTFLRAILQYIHYNYNTQLYNIDIDPKLKHLFSQILFSYKINPQTVLYLGYSDDYYGYQYIPLTQKNRTFFLKIGYALVI